MRLEMLVEMLVEILDVQSSCLFSNESFEKRPVMTIEDFVLHSDDHFESHLLALTPVAGLIFETKNRAIFLERIFGRGITAREQLSRAVILARF